MKTLTIKTMLNAAVKITIFNGRELLGYARRKSARYQLYKGVLKQKQLTIRHLRHSQLSGSCNCENEVEKKGFVRTQFPEKYLQLRT